MKKGWEVKKLGEVCEYSNGKAHEQYIKKEGKYIVINSKFISSDGRVFKRTNEALFPLSQGAIAMVLSDVPSGKALAKCYLIEKDDTYSLNQRICAIRSDKFYDKFLYYQLNRNKHFLSFDNGENQTNLRLNQILDCLLYLPPFSEQKRIVVILDKAFVTIVKAKENAEKNLQNSRELFESYLQNVFANPGKGWEKKKLGEICDFVRGPFGGSLKKSCFKSKGIVVYEQQHAIYDQFEEIRYFIDEKKFNEMKRFEVAPGDLIMSCSGTMGKVAIVPDNVRKGIINQALLKLSPNKNLLARFLKLWMGSPNFQDQLAKYSLGAAIKNVASVKTLKEIDVPLPPLSEQKHIIAKLDAISVETKKLEAMYQQKLYDLDELRKSILQKAFKGELVGACS